MKPTIKHYHVDQGGDLYRVTIIRGGYIDPLITVKIYMPVGRIRWKEIYTKNKWRRGEIIRMVNEDRPVLDFENWKFVESPPKK